DHRKLFGSVIVALIAEFDPVEHGGRHGEIALGRIAVDLLADPMVEPPDLLDQHHAAPRLARRRGTIGIEGKAVAGRDRDALAHAGPPLRGLSPPLHSYAGSEPVPAGCGPARSRAPWA